MSKNGNTSDIAGGACRIGLAVMTVSLAAMLTASTLHAEPFDQTSPVELIKALVDVYGSHPGFRKNHAKGTCATGSFVGMPETTAYSRSQLFSGATIPVVARFSLGGGNPDAPDAGKGPRGMALEFQACRRQQAAHHHDQLADLLCHRAEDVPRQSDRGEARSGDGQTGSGRAQGIRRDAPRQPPG